MTGQECRNSLAGNIYIPLHLCRRMSIQSAAGTHKDNTHKDTRPDTHKPTQTHTDTCVDRKERACVEQTK